MIQNKGSVKKWLLVVVVLLILVGAGIGAWQKGMISFLNTPEENAAREIKRIANTFPNSINNGQYTLLPSSPYKVDVRDECNMAYVGSGATATSTQICMRTFTAWYEEKGGNKVMFVHATNFNTGKDAFKELFKKISKPVTATISRIEKHELGWYPTHTFDLIITQEGVKTGDRGQNVNYPNEASVNNPVVTYFTERFSPNVE